MADQAIPTEAVEAAAYALYLDAHPDTEDQWYDIGFHEQDELLRAAKAALEAAAPFITASAVEYLDESVRRISFDPDVKDYERGFDDATRGMAAKVKRLLNGEDR